MLGRLTVPILPYLRSTSSSPRLRDGVQVRDTIAIERRPGAVVTVYNAQGDGSAAVSADGIVAASASLAYVYQDRAGASIMANPVTLDEIGGPLDLFCAGPGVTSFTFYGFPGVYHLKVTLPNGQTFGIQHVRVPEGDAWNRHLRRMTDITSPATGKPWYYADSAPSPDMGFMFDAARTYRLDGLDLQNPSGFIVAGELIAAGSISAGNFSATTPSGASDQFLSGPGETACNMWGRISVVDARLYVKDSVHPDAATTAGISLGYDGDGGINSPNAASLAALYMRPLTMDWALSLSKGGASVAIATSTLAGVDTPVFAKFFHLRLLYNPNGKVLEGWVNGWFGGRITDAARFPGINIANQMCGMHMFMSEGADANADTDTYFADVERRTLMPL